MSPKCWNCDFVRSLMVDFSRAFDRVDHTLLLKLDGLNFSPNAMNWIISFLTNRTQVVTYHFPQPINTTVITSIVQCAGVGPMVVIVESDLRTISSCNKL